MSLTLRWREPAPALLTRWRGPEGMAEALTRNPLLPIAAIIGPPGEPGPPGSGITGSFSFGDATPDAIGAVEAGRFAATTRIVIDTPFDGIGATLSIGTLADPDLLLPAAGIDAGAAASYEFDSGTTFSADTDLYLFISPGTGASQGSGRFWIDLA